MPRVALRTRLRASASGRALSFLSLSIVRVGRELPRNESVLSLVCTSGPGLRGPATIVGGPMRRNKAGEAAAEIQKSDEQWRQELSKEQYQVLRHAHTERPFTGKYVHNKADGTYTCAGCGAELFKSGTKFESGTGWPSFYEPAIAANIEVRQDRSLGMARTEVICKRCGGHLGHVFDDGPNPTGLRYCINSCALDFD